MRNRIIVLVIALLVAAGSLKVADFWQWKMSIQLDKRQIDNAAYFVQTWTISFVVASAAAAWSAFRVLTHWKRSDSYDYYNDDGGYLIE